MTSVDGWDMTYLWELFVVSIGSFDIEGTVHFTTSDSWIQTAESIIQGNE